MSVDNSDVQISLKEALYETLTETLSAHREIRQAAEQKIQALEVTEEFGIHLTEFIIDPSEHISIRQLASILLKQYVDTHWCSTAEKFRPPEVIHTSKEKIRELLPLGLQESISKVRTAVAYVISTIASWDWPENWPDLLNILISHLSGESEHAVHGAMRALFEFTRDLADTQLPNVGPIILQEMYKVFQSENRYSLRTRGRAVQIFTTITTLVAATGIYQKTFMEQYLQPLIPMFCEKFIECLRVPNGPTSDSRFKTDIIKVINSLVTKVPKYTSNFLPQLLPPVWELFIQSARTYQEETLNMVEDTTEVDIDGEVINFDNLIIAILELFHTIVDHKKFVSVLDNLLHEVMYYLIIFMQITGGQIQLWTDNPNQFVEEEDQGIFAYNVRIAAQELLSAFIYHYQERGANALCDIVARHIGETNKLRISGDANSNETWWKLRESSIFALSISKDTVIQKQQAGTLQFDIVTFIDTVVLGMLNDLDSSPLLLGRCLCFAGRYVQVMPPELCSRFVEATVNGLQENQTPCIRISAVKTIYWFCEAERPNNSINQILNSHLPNIFQGLFDLASQPSTKIVILIMETLEILIALHKEFTSVVENKICPLTIAVFLKFYKDPIILNLCHDIFKELTLNPDCIRPLQTRIVPTLIDMMAVTPRNESQDEGCRVAALDVLQILVHYSSAPLNDCLVENAFPAACHCILNSEDHGTLQSGGEVIRSYLSVGAHQVVARQDDEGQTGLDYILRIVYQLLNPQSSEHTATFIGRLVTTLIKSVGNSLGDHLDQLLKAVLSKMQRTDTLIVMQSLLMIYAQLINTELNAVLNFLSAVPGPTGQSALVFVLTEWLSRQHLFFGRYDRKVTTIALCKMVEYGVTQKDDRLNGIMIKDQVFSGNEDGVKTRSQTESQPYEFTTLPVLVKIFKLIINELSYDIEAASASQDIYESDDEDEDESEDSMIDPGNENALQLEGTDEEDDEDEDQLLKQDPIYRLNLGQYLRDFLLNFSTHKDFSMYVTYLNKQERKVLNSVNITQ